MLFALQQQPVASAPGREARSPPELLALRAVPDDRLLGYRARVLVWERVGLATGDHNRPILRHPDGGMSYLFRSSLA